MPIEEEEEEEEEEEGSCYNTCTEALTEAEFNRIFLG
jgi:hypothetical protein